VGDRESIDALIERLAPQYPVVQLARMDRTLLRSGIGEVLHSGTPSRVAIAEWVELARTYSGEPARRLVNGVLGRMTRDSVAGAHRAPEPGPQ
jgi:N utilization substance protein B